MNYKGHIVIVEDDEILRKAIVNCYKKNDYFTTDFSSASGVYDFISKSLRHESYSSVASDCIPVDIILSDIVMPNETGFELIESLKLFNDVGKIFISVHNEVEDRIKGLSLGVDDYIGKPLDTTELLLRTQVLLTRLNKGNDGSELLPSMISHKVKTGIDFLHFELNPESRFLTSENQKVELGHAEHQLLLLLIGFQGSIVSKQQISDVVYKQSSGVTSRTIDKLISRLRGKLVEVGSKAEYIITQRGKGFMLVSQL